MAKTERFEMRMETDLRSWLADHAKSRDKKDSEVVRELLRALRDGRVIVTPSGPQAFPTEKLSSPGESPHHPILVAFPMSIPDE